MSAFPDDLPDNCPLPGAQPCDCVVFRACAAAPPQESDFLTHAEMGRASTAKGDKACLRFGISVFPTKEACEHMLEVFPANGTFAATGMLEHVHGQIVDTPGRFPSHRTWWPYDGVNRMLPFAGV